MARETTATGAWQGGTAGKRQLSERVRSSPAATAACGLLRSARHSPVRRTNGMETKLKFGGEKNWKSEISREIRQRIGWGCVRTEHRSTSPKRHLPIVDLTPCFQSSRGGEKLRRKRASHFHFCICQSVLVEALQFRLRRKPKATDLKSDPIPTWISPHCGNRASTHMEH